ncbi:hypothetical protein RYX36_030303 [Vicia faba]
MPPRWWQLVPRRNNLAIRGIGSHLELETLGDFTSKDNRDNFFAIRPDSFEWYAEWPNLRDPLISLLQTLTRPPLSLPLLVPGCGNSRLTEHLYDAGSTSITKVDFSKVVISNMLRSNVPSRLSCDGMSWT